MGVRHLLSLETLSKKEILYLIKEAEKIKKNPKNYEKSMEQKTLLMIFAKPSLRTRVSFEVGMTQMGGHGIYYDISTSPMGKKESIADTARTSSRYVDIVMARLFEHKDIEEYAKNSSVPVINALTNFSHPCQILADLLTIKEKKGKLAGLKLAYFGDGANNVAHSLIISCSKMGINTSIACPAKGKYQPNSEILLKAKEQAGGSIEITSDVQKAAENADIIYTDTWVSMGMEKEKEERIKNLMQYQLNSNVLKLARK